jgi:hypothetical protein
MDRLRGPDTNDRLPSMKAQKVKLRKREIALAYVIGAVAALAAVGILSDGFGGPGSSFADDPAPATTSER